MRRMRVAPGRVIGSGLGVIALVLAADAAGWLGGLVVCGADGAAVCVAWPAAASIGTWVLFFGVIAGLGAWQVREWRRDPTPFSPPPPARAASASAQPGPAAKLGAPGDPTRAT